jgi:hypothetical protein
MKHEALTQRFSSASHDLINRFFGSLSHHLSADVQARLVRQLEIAGQPMDIDLLGLNPVLREIQHENFILAPSVQLTMSDNSSLLPREEFVWNEMRGYRIEGAPLDVYSGLAFLKSKVIKQSGTGQRNVRDATFITGALLRVHKSDITQVRGSFAWLGMPPNYYHLLTEGLPKLIRLRELCHEIKFASVDPPPPLLAEIDKDLFDRVVLFPGGSVIQPTTLWTIDPQPIFAPHPADIDLLSRLDRTEVRRTDTPEKVFVTRGDDPRMQRIDHILSKELPLHGFTVVNFSTIPWHEQVTTVSNAQVLIGIHGAGLSNLVFMPKGGQVLELTNGEWWCPCYRRMANAQQHSYHLIVTDDGSAEASISVLSDVIREISA